MMLMGDVHAWCRLCDTLVMDDSSKVVLRRRVGGRCCGFVG
jgi:hypothetical protein